MSLILSLNATRTMYSNNIPTICATVNPDGTAVWKGLTFPLIERKKSPAKAEEKKTIEWASLEGTECLD